MHCLTGSEMSVVDRLWRVGRASPIGVHADSPFPCGSLGVAPWDPLRGVRSDFMRLSICDRQYEGVNRCLPHSLEESRSNDSCSCVIHRCMQCLNVSLGACVELIACEPVSEVYLGARVKEESLMRNVSRETLG